MPGPDGELCPYPGCPRPYSPPALRFDPSRVNWVEASFDIAGIGADVISLGMVGRLVNAADTARRAGDVLDVLSVATDWPQFSIGIIKGDLSTTEGANFGLDIAGLFVPILPDVVSLTMNFSQGLYLEDESTIEE